MSVTKYENIKYGSHERNILDAYITKNHNSPAVIFFHGGGYIEGDKGEVCSNILFEECLENGISIISCNYRFISSDPFPAPMDDGTRAIKFVKYKSEEWGINSNKIVIAGSSAGGHIALWNALKDDLSDNESNNSIDRISSRVAAVIGFSAQVSKDQRFYEKYYDGPYIQPNISMFYGIDSIHELKQPDILKIAENASAINFMSKDAPPAFMVYYHDFKQPWISKDASLDEVIHHPIHGYVLEQEYKKHDINYYFRHKGNPIQTGELSSFILNL